MKIKIVSLFAALLMVLSVLAACNNEPEVEPDLTTPSDVATSTPTLKPSPSPSATPTPVPTSQTDEIELPPSDAPADPNNAGTFAELGAQSTLIIRGEFVKKLDETYNAVRSMDNGADPDPLYIIEQEQWEFKITEIYKQDEKKDKLKVGDTITVNTDLTDLYSAGSTPKKLASYLEMNLEEDSVLFLERFDFNPDRPVYQSESEIFCFTVSDGKLYARCADEKKIEAWNKAAKTTDGVPIGNMKEDIKGK